MIKVSYELFTIIYVNERKNYRWQSIRAYIFLGMFISILLKNKYLYK